MSKIIKTTQGEAAFRTVEEYENEDKAIKGKEPINQEIVIDELKIENIKYKLKEVLNDGKIRSEAIKTREET
tara:strand:+ start:8126 stop:8341 length:216 start_codon:yes stop_codon:yes gene_type:complete